MNDYSRSRLETSLWLYTTMRIIKINPFPPWYKQYDFTLNDFFINALHLIRFLFYQTLPRIKQFVHLLYFLYSNYLYLPVFGNIDEAVLAFEPQVHTHQTEIWKIKSSYCFCPCLCQNLKFIWILLKKISTRLYQTS